MMGGVGVASNTAVGESDISPGTIVVPDIDDDTLYPRTIEAFGPGDACKPETGGVQICEKAYGKVKSECWKAEIGDHTFIRVGWIDNCYFHTADSWVRIEDITAE